MYNIYYSPAITFPADTWKLTERDWSRVKAGKWAFSEKLSAEIGRDRIEKGGIRKNLLKKAHDRSLKNQELDETL